MNGLIVINKPKGFTSRDVINKLTKILSYKNIGHTGTLDPLATGVLVCLLGKYTKLSNDITAMQKEYVAKMKLGVKTDTGDITGNILKEENSFISIEKIKEVFASFPRVYMQTVPKYSAVKINGKKLYEYARENIEITLPKREVNIYSLELLDYENGIITFKTCVSKGTYIRSLIEDLASKMNTYGTMLELIRTKQGDFTLDEAYTLDEVINNKYKIKNIKEFLNYEVMEIPDELVKKITNGARIKNDYNISDKVIFTYQGKDIAIYEKEYETLKPYLML